MLSSVRIEKNVTLGTQEVGKVFLDTDLPPGNNIYILISGFLYWRELIEWASLQASFASQFYFFLPNYFKKRPLNSVQAAEMNIPPRVWCFSGTSIKNLMYHSDTSAYKCAVKRSIVKVLITSFPSLRVSSTIVPRKPGPRISCLTPTDITLDETGIEVRQEWKSY